MLKSEYIEIPTRGCRKLEYFKDKGYDIESDFLNIKIVDLNIGSRVKIDVICDFCEKEVNITYKEYYRNVSIGNKYACCKYCGSIKAKESNLQKYGEVNAMCLKETQKKQRNTNIKKYGVEFLQQSKKIREKSKYTLMKKYGVDHVSKAEEVRYKISNISKDDLYIRYLSDNESLFICNEGNHEFKIKNDNYYTRNKSNLPICTICYPIGNSSSLKELEFVKFIRSVYKGLIIERYKDILEIDIYLPDLKIGFEFNGLYWHSNLFKEKNYHLEKTNYFKKRGIRIIHIWEDDWINKKNIIQSQVKNWLQLNAKIYARNCEVKEVSNTDFLNANHIQGNVSSVLKLGLFYNNQLVSLMTFDHFEGRKKMNDAEWNLNRFCNLLNINVIGGASKLLSYFIKNYNPERIISYADKDWSLGDLYKTLNFNIVYETKPDYKYVIDGKRIHKSRYRKSRTNISESKLDIPKIYDCGKMKFEMIVN